MLGCGVWHRSVSCSSNKFKSPCNLTHGTLGLGLKIRLSDHPEKSRLCTAAAPYGGVSSQIHVSKQAKVDVGDAYEVIEVDVAESSEVLCVAIDQPLGITFEEIEGDIVADEIAEDSNAALAKVQVGDILRGTTAVAIQMTYPTANLLLGGVGRPAYKKILLPTKGRSFQGCMDAIRSNAELDGRVTLVLERPRPQVTEAEGADSAEDSTEESKFDPRIFE